MGPTRSVRHDPVERVFSCVKRVCRGCLFFLASSFAILRDRGPTTFFVRGASQVLQKWIPAVRRVLVHMVKVCRNRPTPPAATAGSRRRPPTRRIRSMRSRSWTAVLCILIGRCASVFACALSLPTVEVNVARATRYQDERCA